MQLHSPCTARPWRWAAAAHQPAIPTRCAHYSSLAFKGLQGSIPSPAGWELPAWLATLALSANAITSTLPPGLALPAALEVLDLVSVVCWSRVVRQWRGLAPAAPDAIPCSASVAARPRRVTVQPEPPKRAVCAERKSNYGDAAAGAALPTVAAHVTAAEQLPPRHHTRPSATAARAAATQRGGRAGGLLCRLLLAFEVCSPYTAGWQVHGRAGEPRRQPLPAHFQLPARLPPARAGAQYAHRDAATHAHAASEPLTTLVGQQQAEWDHQPRLGAAGKPHMAGHCRCGVGGKCSPLRVRVGVSVHSNSEPVP